MRTFLEFRTKAPDGPHEPAQVTLAEVPISRETLDFLVAHLDEIDEINPVIED